MIAAIGAALKKKLDAKAVTSLLLNALVPAVIVVSLSSLTLSSDLSGVVAGGVLLAALQVGVGELGARLVVPRAKEDETGSARESRKTLTRTAAMQLGTMAPALSVYSFTREFAGPLYGGLAALADVPNKIYTLILFPIYFKRRGEAALVNSGSALAPSPALAPAPVKKRKRLASTVGDPFNLAIGSGLVLAALGMPVKSLGFFGTAIGNLASAQTSVLFLLIGLKLKFGGARARFCLRLLLARHGLIALSMSFLLAALLPPLASSGAGAAAAAQVATRESARLAATLSSQAASSIIAYGQMAKVVAANPEVEAKYDLDTAFDIVALSFPLTIVLNTVACLAGNAYVNALPVIGTVLLAGSFALGVSDDDSCEVETQPDVWCEVK